MLTKKQLEATTSLSEYSPEKELAQTALAYRAMLERLEYVKDTGRIGGAIYKFCPICGVSELNGHTADCELSALLKGV